ncbi:MAG TPA: S9 family peptidase [Gammaproteobacteria bacterium]
MSIRLHFERRYGPLVLAFGLLAACAERSAEITTPLAAPTARWAELAAPVAEKRPVEITQQGRTRVDNYAWLKDDDWQTVLRDPEVLAPDIRAHLEAELEYYGATTAESVALRGQLLAEMRGRIKEDDATVPVEDGPFEYYTRYREGGEYPIFARRPAGGGAEEVLVDGDVEAGEGAFFRIESVDPSPDHALIAYGVDRLGSEYYAIRFRRLADETELDETIPSTAGYVVWSADSRSVLYVERDDNQRPKRVKRHVLGTDAAADSIVYEESDNGMFVDVGRSQSGEYAFIEIANEVTSEVRYLRTDATDATPILVAPRIENELYSVEHHGDEFFILTNGGGAVDFKIVRAPVATPRRESWTDWVAHSPGAQILSFVAYADHNVRLELADALPRIVVSDYEGDAHAIAFEEAAYTLNISAGREYQTALTRVVYESPAQPAQTFDYDMSSRRRTLRKTREIPSGHDPNLYAVERITAPAEDGAEVPVTILRLGATRIDGTAPVLLYGYGSYGISTDAEFSANVLPLVDRGVIYAIGHVRGGAERGRQWYLDGKLGKKVNTFTDLVAVAETLAERGYASAGRIALHGGSAGGLLVGAAVNLRPELFAGVLAEVPFVDVLNTISDESLPLTPPEWPEWGDPIRTVEGYEWIASYSPYDNIRAGAVYPPILATGGLTDYRVTYWEPAKWVARLRDEARGGPFLLRMNMSAGHAGAAARFQQLDELAHLYAFALEVLGRADAEPVEHGN